MSINVIEVLKKQLEVLQTIGSLPEDGDCTEHLSAIKNILEFIDDIDVANGLLERVWVVFSVDR